VTELDQVIARGKAENLAQGERIDQLTEEHRSLEQEHRVLRHLVEAHGGAEVWANGQSLEKSRAQVAKATEELRALRAEYHDLTRDLVYEESGGDIGATPGADTIELQGQIRGLAETIRDLEKEGATSDRGAIYVDDMTSAQRRAVTRKLTSLALRAFKAETAGIVAAATANNEEASAQKIYRAADQIGKMVEVVDGRISPQYIDARVRELRLAVRYAKRKAFERELERERRAELREQARAERELEAERGRLSKELQHCENIRAAFVEKGDDEAIARMDEKLTEIQTGIENVEQRAANIRAGYVYVISNIGAFGERMVKIGLTRRLDPMDRVRELGDASVPFGFDVHALFFSEDAVEVEAELHRRFAAKRVNRVNLRREFFYATPAEVRRELASVTGDLIEFHETAEAEQFRESTRLAQAGRLIAEVTDGSTVRDGLGWAEDHESEGRRLRERQDRDAEEGGA
jgi:hypothetical protein